MDVVSQTVLGHAMPPRQSLSPYYPHIQLFSSHIQSLAFQIALRWPSRMTQSALVSTPGSQTLVPLHTSQIQIVTMTCLVVESRLSVDQIGQMGRLGWI